MSDPVTPKQELSTVEGERHLNQVASAFTFVPKSITEAMEVSKAIASSELCPRDYLGHKNPAASILVAVMTGAKYGLDPFQSVNSIAVINGRPTMWGDAVLGIVKASGLLMAINERTPEEALQLQQGRCAVWRKGEAAEVVRTFSMEEAKTAGLIDRSAGKGPWVTYPGRMLQMRARSWALRDVFPDVLKGIKIREEEQDIHEAQYTIREPQEKAAIEPGKVDAFLQETSKAATSVARSGGAPSRSDSSASAGGGAGGKEWVGQVAKVEVAKKGTSKDKKTGKDKPYTLYAIHGKDGMKFGTFSDTDADVARSAGSGGDLVKIRFEEGQYGAKALSVSLQSKAEEIPPYEYDAEREPGQEG